MNKIIKKAFYHPHISNSDSPDNYTFNYQEYFLTTSGGKKIQTYFIGTENSLPFIVMIHGWENCAEKFFTMAENLAARGWKVALVNARNHGESDGDDYSTMVKFSEDISATISFILSEFGSDQNIGLFGHSLGGATSLYLAAKDTRIKAVAAAGSFADLEKLLRDSFLAHHVPAWLISPLVLYIEYRIGEKLVNLSPLANVSRLSKPLCLIHGKRDEVIPYSDYERLTNHANPTYLKTVSDDQADHSSLLSESRLFNELDGFFKQALINGKAEL